MPTDTELLARYRNGDVTAFEALVTRWNPALLNLGARLLGDVEEARDVRQQAWTALVHRDRAFEGRAALGTWLYRVVVNACRDRLRRGSLMEADEQVRPSPDPHTPADEAQRAETASHVAAAVDCLPALEREALVLRHYHDLSFPEIAAVLDIPATTVKSRVARALSRLEARLAELRPRA